MNKLALLSGWILVIGLLFIAIFIGIRESQEPSIVGTWKVSQLEPLVNYHLEKTLFVIIEEDTFSSNVMGSLTTNLYGQTNTFRWSASRTNWYGDEERIIQLTNSQDSVFYWKVQEVSNTKFSFETVYNRITYKVILTP